jgi:hypothetical protein
VESSFERLARENGCRNLKVSEPGEADYIRQQNVQEAKAASETERGGNSVRFKEDINVYEFEVFESEDEESGSMLSDEDFFAGRTGEDFQSTLNSNQSAAPKRRLSQMFRVRKFYSHFKELLVLLTCMYRKCLQGQIRKRKKHLFKKKIVSKIMPHQSLTHLLLLMLYVFLKNSSLY